MTLIRRLAVCAVAAASLGFGACGATSTITYDYSKEPDPRRLEFVIGVSDRLRITVWKNPELTTDATVRPDGTITMPLVGDLPASGKTPSELKAMIATKLSNWVKDDAAVVTVAVAAVNSYAFTVSGNVERPGVFNAQKYVSVLEAIQLAGGPNRFASSEITLIRKGENGTASRKIPIDYKALSSGMRPDSNLAIIAGDIIIVP